MSTLMSQARVRVPRAAWAAAAAVERARLTVVPAHAPRTRRAPFAALVIVVLVSGLVGLLMVNTQMQQNSFTVTALQTQASALAAKQQSLTLSVQQLRSPGHVALAARKLGMVAPTNPAFLDLRTGKILGIPLAATPADKMRIAPPRAAKPPMLRPKPFVVHVSASAGAGTATRRTGSNTGSNTGAGSAAGTTSTGRNSTTGHTHH